MHKQNCLAYLYKYKDESYKWVSAYCDQHLTQYQLIQIIIRINILHTCLLLRLSCNAGKMKLSLGSGDSVSKKFKRGSCGGVCAWRGLRGQTVGFVLVRLAGIWLQSPWRCFTLNLLYKKILSTLFFQCCDSRLLFGSYLDSIPSLWPVNDQSVQSIIWKLPFVYCVNYQQTARLLLALWGHGFCRVHVLECWRKENSYRWNSLKAKLNFHSAP
jgi:hypothetical protein